MAKRKRQPKQQTNTDYTAIPVELRGRPQWVCYTLEPNEDGVLTKIPRHPPSGARAKINDPADWCTFEDALARVERYDGLEYMLTADDPFTFVDLDHCVDETTGEPSFDAQRIINRFDTYTELSQSGHGIHIIGIGRKPGPRCRIASAPGIEMYDSARPIVITGNVIQGKRLIQPCANEIGGLYEQLFGEVERQSEEWQRTLDDMECEADTSTQSAEPVADDALSDSELIARACAAPKAGAAFTRLWNGNTSDHNNDDSAADQALCNHLAWWTNRDPNRIDRLFRQSGLMREKWEKRPDYRRRTIDKAVRDTRGGYQPKHTSKSSTAKRKKRTQPIKRVPANVDPRTGEVLGAAAELKHLTDLGNAEYMIAQHGTTLRYDVDSGRWLHWQGAYWRRDDTGEVERLARNTIRSLYDLLKREDDHERAKKLFSHIIKSESRPRIEATIALARYCPGIPVHASDLDADQWALNCANGTVDLRTGKLRPHAPADMFSKIISINYNPDAKCPRWEQFLREVFMGDATLVNFIRRVIGYCLTGDTSEESVFIFYGRGQCGKSKFVDTIRYILGDYIKDTPVTTFMERRDSNTADLASLVGARLVTASEAEDQQAFNEPLLKRISGRDPITCRYLYKDFFTYFPTFKVVFATNDVPCIRSQSYAMKRRIKVVPFRQRFYDPEENQQPVKDERIYEKLIAEAEGILAWAVRGCLEWQRGGLQVPQIVKDEVNGIFESQDPLAEFIDSECIVHHAATVMPADLYYAYKAWCEMNKQSAIFRRSSSLSRNLVKRDGIVAIRDVFKKRVLRGIGLISQNLDLVTDGTDKQYFAESSPCKSFMEDFPESTSYPSPSVTGGDFERELVFEGDLESESEDATSEDDEVEI